MPSPRPCIRVSTQNETVYQAQWTPDGFFGTCKRRDDRREQYATGFGRLGRAARGVRPTAGATNCCVPIGIGI